MRHELPKMTTISVSGTKYHHEKAADWCLDNLGVDGYIMDGHKWRRDYIKFADRNIWDTLANREFEMVFEYSFAEESDAVLFKLAWA